MQPDILNYELIAKIYLMISCSNRGFTFLELLVTVGIIGILMSVSVPTLNNHNKNQRLVNAPREFVALLQYARSEAVKRNSIVNVETQLVAKDDYGGEIHVCITSSAATSCSNAASEIIKKVTIATEDVSIRASGTSAGADGNISFRANGRLNEGNNQEFLGFCDDRGTTTTSAQFLTINVTGRAFVERLDTTEGHRCNPDN